jgi:uncharacterized membrane protein
MEREMDIIHSWPGGVHAVAAILALVWGGQVLARPKGGRAHRRLGYAYVAAMSVMLLAGLPMMENGISPFHGLSVVSAVTLAGGVVMAVRARRAATPQIRQGRLYGHFKFMAWSYAGLVAAGVAQLSTRVVVAVGGMAGFWWAVVLASLAVCAVAAVWMKLAEPVLAARYKVRP